VRLPLGSAGYIGERNYTFYAHHPLVVQLQPLGKAVSGAGTGDALDQLMDAPQRHAIGFYALCADAWDFERAYSLQNPQTLAKRWSARERRALQTGELAQGLSHEVVAWIWGWPSLYGTKQELGQEVNRNAANRSPTTRHPRRAAPDALFGEGRVV
jgi:hypothetical protein